MQPSLRRRAFADVTPAGGGSPPEIKVGTDNSVMDARNETAAVITANPGVRHRVVRDCNDESETGAATALPNSGVSPDNAIGADLACKDWKAGKSGGTGQPTAGTSHERFRHWWITCARAGPWRRPRPLP